MLMFASGDFLIVFVNGELIEHYGAMIQPAAICSYCILMTLLLALTMFLHRRYQQIRAEIMLHSDEFAFLKPKSPRGGLSAGSPIVSATGALPAETMAAMAVPAMRNDHSKSSVTNSAGTVPSMTISIDGESI